MFGRNRWLDLFVALILLAIVAFGLMAVLGMFALIPLRYPESFLEDYVLTPDQHASVDIVTNSIQQDLSALQQGILNSCEVAAALAVLWLLVITFWGADRPARASRRGYVWMVLLVLVGALSWGYVAAPIAALPTQTAFILPFRVLATGWGILSFVIATWIATPSIAVPALGPLGKLRFIAMRPIKAAFSRGEQ